VSVSPQTRALLALHLAPDLGPLRTAALLERFGSALAVVQASAAQFSDVPHIGQRLADKLSTALRQVDVDGELQELAKHNTYLRVLGSLEYPPALATITGAPHLLYVRGTIEPRDAQAVALVGSRDCTTYGKRVAERLAGELARAGWTVISGLARGIDSMAHRGALEAGGRTLAVLAGGLSKIYPPEHTGLAREVEAAGAVLSEAPMKQSPLPGMFPARNRIISGLARAVVIVEANEKSGALITAEHAAEQGRPVFAIPGPIDSPASAGAHRLIRDGAILCRGLDDILEELQTLPPPAPAPMTWTPGLPPLAPAAAPAAEPAPAVAAAAPVPVGPPPDLSAEQRRIWDFLAGEPRHVDQMAQQLSLSVPQLSGLLMMLEMKKVVRRLPGNRYERWA
jgi:DNA processing protein